MKKINSAYCMHMACETKECPYIDAKSMATECSINPICPEYDAYLTILNEYKKTGTHVTDKYLTEQIAEIVFGGHEWIEKMRTEIEDIKARISEAISLQEKYNYKGEKQ